MSDFPIRTIAVIGAGTIGAPTAALYAARGFTTILIDRDHTALDTAMARIRGFFDQARILGRQSPDEAEQALGRLMPGTDPALAAPADLLHESVPEDIDAKRRVFSLYAGLCKPEAFFATNTSDLPPSLLAESTGRPERFAAFHFHDPLREGNIVDIMPHPGTAPQTLELLRGLALRLGQTPLSLRREHAGYVFNNLLNALTRAALELALEGVAAPEEVDLAWTRVMGAPIGPFGVLDRVGLDTARDIARLGALARQDPGLQRIADYLAGYVDQGRLGVKSGQGFYRHDPHLPATGV